MTTAVSYTVIPPQCAIALRTGGSQDAVAQFYKSRLSEGDWTLDSFSDQTGRMTFHRISRPQDTGTVTFVARQQGTDVHILVKGS